MIFVLAIIIREQVSHEDNITDRWFAHREDTICCRIRRRCGQLSPTIRRCGSVAPPDRGTGEPTMKVVVQKKKEVSWIPVSR